MTATEHFNSLDATLRKAKDDHEIEIKGMSDALLAAQIESTMCKDRLREALLDRDAHMRVSTKLIAQFALVERVFAEAKALALAHFGEKPITEEDKVQPPVQIEDQTNAKT